MKPKPSTSKPFTSPRQKRKASLVSENEKNMIVNIFKHIQEAWINDKCKSKMNMKQKTADILGIGKTDNRVLKEQEELDTVKRAGLLKKLPNMIESIDVNSDIMFPNLNQTILWNMSNHSILKYMTKKNNRALIKRHDIILWRNKYIQKIKKYREEARPIYYLDETWMSAGHSITKAWEDSTVKSVRQNVLVDSLATENNPITKGNRFVIVHIGNEKGFLPGCQWVFEDKATEDCHVTMNAYGFEKWFENVLTKVEKNAVIVMDNASYHLRLQERLPVTSWRKRAIQDWFCSKGISFEVKETKAELLVKFKKIKERYQSYVTDEMAKQYGVEVLRLPPYHSELNPIELVWAAVKRYVAQNNTSKTTDIKRLIEEGLNNINETKWKNCVEHVIKEEQVLNALDDNTDKSINNFIINMTNSYASCASEHVIKIDTDNKGMPL